MADGNPTEAPEAPQLRWVDAFPWVAAAEHDSGDAAPWWLDPIDTDATAVHQSRLSGLSDLALSRLTRWTIGQIFPLLPASANLYGLPLTNRARNALMRFGFLTIDDLQGFELGKLLDLPNVGVGTADSILQVLADASMRTQDPEPYIGESHQPGKAADAYSEQARRTIRIGSFASDLQTLANWYAALGMPSRPLLGEPTPPGSPLEVISAWQRLEALTAVDVLAQERAELDAAELLQCALSTLDHRATQILARRFFADRPQTLEEIAIEIGVTRERVRQIEARARAELVQALEPGGSLSTIGASVRELIGTVLPLDELLRLVPALARKVDAVGQPAWRVLDRLDDGYEIEDGWSAAPTLLGAKTETLTRLQENANEHGVAAIADLSPLSPHQAEGSVSTTIREWLRYCGCEIYGDWVFGRVSTVSDRAASILSVIGSPMSSQEILDRLGVERSLTSLKNSMAGDDRFDRVDRDMWALAEWGLETYDGIRALVRDEVSRSGGEISLAALVKRITGKYTVSAASVIAYASTPPFEAKSGIVRFSTGDRHTRKSPQRTRRFYRRGNTWLYRVTVTHEHLRGSGSPAPVALATILGLQNGQTCHLTSRLGPQTVTWSGNQPAFGTIRRFLIDSDIETGSEIFLIIGDDGSFCIEPVTGGDAGPLEHALFLAGVSNAATSPKPLVALASAIGLPESSSAASVIGGYRERGDTDVAELLLAARSELDEPSPSQASTPSPAIDEILDLL
jgi:RNA polymerase sigma factor (sigma-70 family)